MLNDLDKSSARNGPTTMKPTWKRFYFTRRNPALTPEQFPVRWRQHAELGATFPDGLKRHTRLNYGLVNADHSASDAQHYDGIGILWLGSPAMLDRVNDDPLCTPTMRQDELLVFQQPVYNSAMVAEERICKDGPLTKVALLRFIRRAPGVADKEFGEACETIGRSLSGRAGAGSGVRRCAWGTVVRKPTISFDSFMEFWFDTLEDALAAMNDAAFEIVALHPLAFLIDGFETSSNGGDARYLVEICHERVTPQDDPATGLMRTKKL